MKTDPSDLTACKIIDGLNGTVAVADLCEIRPSAVSHWRKHGIPKARVKFLRLARADFDWSQVPESYPEKSTKESV